MVTYRLDTVGFREHVLNPPWMVEEVRSRAEKAGDLFESIAPVGEPFEGDDHIGEFRDSGVVTSGRDGGVKHDRAFGRFASVDPLALTKEYGHIAPNGRFVDGSHAILRSMDAMGGRASKGEIGAGGNGVGRFGGGGARRQKKRAQLTARREAARVRREAETPEARQARLAAGRAKRAAKKIADARRRKPK